VNQRSHRSVLGDVGPLARFAGTSYAEARNISYQYGCRLGPACARLFGAGALITCYGKRGWAGADDAGVREQVRRPLGATVPGFLRCVVHRATR
jgi:hypothetical protein